MNCAAVEWALAQDAPSSSAKLLLVAIASRTEGGSLRASQAELARIVQLTDRQVRTLLKLLVAAKLVKRTSNPGVGAGRVADTLAIAFGQPEVQTEEIAACLKSEPKSKAVAKPRQGSRKSIPQQPEIIAARQAEVFDGTVEELGQPEAPPMRNNSTPQELNLQTVELVALPATPAKRRKRGGQFNPAWELGEEGRAFANGIGFLNGSADALFDRFKDHHLGKGSIMADWSAAWRTWVRNEFAWKGAPNNDHTPRQHLNQRSSKPGRKRDVETEILMRDIVDDQPISYGRLDFNAGK